VTFSNSTQKTIGTFTSSTEVLNYKTFDLSAVGKYLAGFWGYADTSNHIVAASIINLNPLNCPADPAPANPTTTPAPVNQPAEESSSVAAQIIAVAIFIAALVIMLLIGIFYNMREAKNKTHSSP